MIDSPHFARCYYAHLQYINRPTYLKVWEWIRETFYV